ncbi:hypothetical protein K445DRAFT_28353 [Daldinia sp. EC12]|nr:hypothetical protein K445DRAFT_28353 [Daldinia sp. EC12]
MASLLRVNPHIIKISLERIIRKRLAAFFGVRLLDLLKKEPIETIFLAESAHMGDSLTELQRATITDIEQLEQQELVLINYREKVGRKYVTTCTKLAEIQIQLRYARKDLADFKKRQMDDEDGIYEVDDETCEEEDVAYEKEYATYEAALHETLHQGEPSDEL